MKSIANGIIVRGIKPLNDCSACLEEATGDPFETIVRVAGKVDVDVLLLMTQGRSNLNRWILSSLRSEVINIANTLVLLSRVPA